jgi:hypothetical protein
MPRGLAGTAGSVQNSTAGIKPPEVGIPAPGSCSTKKNRGGRGDRIQKVFPKKCLCGLAFSAVFLSRLQLQTTLKQAAQFAVLNFGRILIL